MLWRNALIPVLLAALAGLQRAAAQPTEADRIKACGKLKQDACRVVTACTFCRSKWGEPMCFSANQIEKLPADIYPCKYYQSTPTTSTCDGLEKDKCKEAGGCSWCESAAVGNACYTAEDAKRLPPAIFNCTSNPAASLQQASPSPALPPVASMVLDAPSLLDTGAVDKAETITAGAQSKQGASASQQAASGPSGPSVYNIGGRAQQFSFATKVDSALSTGQPASP